MEALLIEDGSPQFLIEFNEENFEVSASFNVYKVNTWYDNVPVEKEKYMSGRIKWDGCSTITFGDGDGSLHLCGRYYFNKHTQVLDALWNMCSRKIICWNNDVATK